MNETESNVTTLALVEGGKTDKPEIPAFPMNLGTLQLRICFPTLTQIKAHGANILKFLGADVPQYAIAWDAETIDAFVAVLHDCILPNHPNVSRADLEANVTGPVADVLKYWLAGALPPKPPAAA